MTGSPSEWDVHQKQATVHPASYPKVIAMASQTPTTTTTRPVTSKRPAWKPKCISVSSRYMDQSSCLDSWSEADRYWPHPLGLHSGPAIAASAFRPCWQTCHSLFSSNKKQDTMGWILPWILWIGWLRNWDIWGRKQAVCLLGERWSLQWGSWCN